LVDVAGNPASVAVCRTRLQKRDKPRVPSLP
jgi:hypothetical protein